jgi:hypothetical protein
MARSDFTQGLFRRAFGSFGNLKRRGDKSMIRLTGAIQASVIAHGLFAMIGCGGNAAGQPFTGKALEIPGRIEAEDFDEGGQGTAFHVLGSHTRQSTDEWSSQYRSSPIKIGAAEPNGYLVTELHPGEWLNYTVRVAKTGTYAMRFRTASVGCGGSFHIEVGNKNVTGPLKFPNTSSFNRDWEYIEVDGVELQAGKQSMRLVIDGSGIQPTTAGSIDHFEVTSAVPKKPIHGRLASPENVAHPRLFVTESRLAEIRKAVRVPGSHHQAVLELLQEGVRLWMIPGVKFEGPYVSAIRRAGLAEEAAMLYLVTGDNEYAQFAFRVLRSLLDDGSNALLVPRLPRDFLSPPLERAAVGMAFAISYDWLYNAWSDEQRKIIQHEMADALDAWPCVGGRWFESPFDTPFTGAFRGAELIMMLAANEEASRAPRYATLKRWLLAHIEKGYGASGLAPTGAEVDLAMSFVLPAAFAARDIGDLELFNHAEQLAWWQTVMVADYVGLMDSPADLPHAGWRNLLFGIVGQDQLAYYRWFYDRRYGKNASRPNYDGGQGGAVWALLYYPDKVEPRDPNGALSTVLADKAVGAFVLRSDWHDDLPLVFSAFADTIDSESSLEFPRAFNVGLQLGGRPLIIEDLSNPEHASSLLVDGTSFDANNRRDTGRIEQFTEYRDKTASLVIDGTAKYARLGLKSARRRLWIDFSKNSGAPVLWSSLDEVRSDTEHLYAWQLNLGRQTDVTVQLSQPSRGSEGVPSFLTRWDNGVGLKGWVLSPKDAVLESEKCRECGPTGDYFLRVTSKGTDEAIWVVVALTSNEVPPAIVSGVGLDATIDIGGTKIRFDRKDQQLVGERRASVAR